MRRDLANSFFVGFIALSWLLAAACNRDVEQGEGAAPGSGPVSVRCVPVKEGTATDAVEIRGTVAPPFERDALVAPQVMGRLLGVSVQEGDTVKAGQIVARVDASALVDQAMQADAVLARARAESHNAKTTRARIERVFEQGIAARQEVDDATARELSTKADEDEAAAVARQAHRQIERATVRSPMAGVVLKVLRKPGELVDGTPATPVVEIADTSTLELVADAPTQDLVRLERGAPASFSFPSMPGGALKGTVSRVAPSVDRSTGLGTVRVTINADGGAQPPVGTFGTARVETGAPHPVMLVPLVAVRGQAAEEAEVVACGKDKKAHVLKVRLGAVRGGFVEVGSGLGPTDRVAVAPVIGLADGDSIELQP